MDDDFCDDLFHGPDRANPDRIWEAMMRVRGGSVARPDFILDWIQEVGAGEAFWPIVSRAWSGFDRIPHEEFAEWFQGLCCTNHLRAGVPLAPDGLIPWLS